MIFTFSAVNMNTSVLILTFLMIVTGVQPQFKKSWDDFLHNSITSRICGLLSVCNLHLTDKGTIKMPNVFTDHLKMCLINKTKRILVGCNTLHKCWDRGIIKVKML